MKCALAICILLCALPAAYAQGATSPKPTSRPEQNHPEQTQLNQTFTALENTFIRAAKKGDIAFFQRTLADDFSFVDSDGQLHDRQEMIDARSDPGFDILPYNMKVLPAGEDVVIVTYDVVLRVPPEEDQGPPPRYQHFSTVWIKKSVAWQMKFQQMSVSHWGDW